MNDDDRSDELVERLRADAAAVRAERDRYREALREVAASGVEFDDARVGYVTVQIDRPTWQDVQALAEADDE